MILPQADGVIRQGLSFKSRSQRDAGLEWKILSLPANIVPANDFCQFAPTASSYGERNPLVGFNTPCAGERIIKYV